MRKRRFWAAKEGFEWISKQVRDDAIPGGTTTAFERVPGNGLTNKSAPEVKCAQARSSFTTVTLYFSGFI
jgi:hypothetical protein